MALIPNGIPIRLVAIVGDAELPDGGVEIGTLNLPVTVTQSPEQSHYWDVTPDVSVVQRLADFVENEQHVDPEHRALDDENVRMDVQRADLERQRVYEDPSSSQADRIVADKRAADVRDQRMRRGRF